MTTPCRHRFPHARTHTRRPRVHRLERLASPRCTAQPGPRRPRPSRYAAGTDGTSSWPPSKNTPTGPSGSIANRREIALLEIPRLDLLLRSRAA